MRTLGGVKKKTHRGRPVPISNNGGGGGWRKRGEVENFVATTLETGRGKIERAFGDGNSEPHEHNLRTRRNGAGGAIRSADRIFSPAGGERLLSKTE